MHIWDAQLLRDLEMHLASSISLISSSLKVLYFKGMVYGFVEIGGPVVGRSISMRLVHQKSAEDLEIISANWLVSIVLSLCWTSNGMFASCSWIGYLLLSCAWVVKLELSGKAGSRDLGGWDLASALALWCFSEYELCILSTLSTLFMEPKMVFLGSLMTVFCCVRL